MVPPRHRRIQGKAHGRRILSSARTAAFRILLAWIALEALRAIASVVVPAGDSAPGDRQLAWSALSDMIVVIAVGVVATRSDWRGWKLGAALASIPFTVALVNIIEGLFYLQEAHLDGPRLIARAVLTFAASALVWGRIFDTDHEPGAPRYHPWASRTFLQQAGRFVVSDVAYLALYLTGGFAILPMVRDFYATRTLPSPGVMFALQFLVRGPLFIGVCLVLVRMIGLSRTRGAVAAGTIFAVVSGVAPLMVPTPHLPDAIRWVHFFEVSITNFLFAVVVAAMWGPPKHDAVSPRMRPLTFM